VRTQVLGATEPIWVVRLTSVLDAFSDEKKETNDDDEDDDGVSGLTTEVGKGHEEHEEETSGMEDLSEQGQQDGEETYDGEESSVCYAQWDKEYYER